MVKKSFLIAIALAVVLISAVALFFYSRSSSQPTYLEGGEVLEIQVLGPDGGPISNLEVDLWTSETPAGPPSAGVSATNGEGIAVFKIPEGNYLVGFNMINFPEDFSYPAKNPVSAEKGMLNRKIISLSLKQGSGNEPNPGQAVQSWKQAGAAIPGNYADAEILDLGNGMYRLYYSPEPESQGFSGQVYSAISSDGIVWSREEGQRIEMATFPSVIMLPDKSYRMYFQDQGVIKSAASDDGLLWSRESGTRVDKSNNAGLNLENVAAPTVMRIGDEYAMVYRGTINEKYPGKVPNDDTQLLLWASSKDGLIFENKGIALDSRTEELQGLIDGPEFVMWDDGYVRIYFWSYRGVYYSVFGKGKFSEPVFDFSTSSDPQNRFPENPPGDPTLAKINGRWLMYYGQHGEGIFYSALSD